MMAAALGVAFVASVQAAAVSFDPNSGYTASFGSTLAAGWSEYTAAGGQMATLPTNFAGYTSGSTFDNSYVQGDWSKKGAGTLYGVKYPVGTSNNWGLCVSPTGDTGEAMAVVLKPTSTLTDPKINITYRLVGAGYNQYGSSSYPITLPGLFCYYSTDGGTVWTRIQSLDSNKQAGVTTQTNGFDWQNTAGTVGSSPAFPVAGIPDTTLGTSESFKLTLTGVTVAANQTLELRWLEANGPLSPEANVAITAFGVNSVPEPTLIGALSAASFGLLVRRRAKKA